MNHRYTVEDLRIRRQEAEARLAEVERQLAQPDAPGFLAGERAILVRKVLWFKSHTEPRALHKPRPTDKPRLARPGEAKHRDRSDEPPLDPDLADLLVSGVSPEPVAEGEISPEGEKHENTRPRAGNTENGHTAANS